MDKIPDRLFDALVNYKECPYSPYEDEGSIKDIGLCMIDWKVEITD